MYVIIAILLFGVLIAVHEFGHFITAKACDVQVNEFSIGMGPLLLHKQKGETLYSWRLLPIGGFCAMEGEDESSENPRAFGNRNFFQKLLILCAGSAMNYLMGIVLLVIVFASASGFSWMPASPISPGFHSGSCLTYASPQFCRTAVQESPPVVHRLRLSPSP